MSGKRQVAQWDLAPHATAPNAWWIVSLLGIDERHRRACLDERGFTRARAIEQELVRLGYTVVRTDG